MEESEGISKWPIWVFRILLVLGFVILLTRISELTLIKGAYFRNLSEGNRIRRVPIEARRGEIHARGGELLADSREVDKKLEFDPKQGFEIVDKGAASADETYVEWEREYGMGERLGHVTGYIGEVSESEVQKVNPECPDKGIMLPGTFVGRSGLEEEYQCKLSGIPGEELFEVDSKGNLIRKLGSREAIAGDDVVTNIDFGLQEKVAEAMHGQLGVAVVSDGKGEVLALYSTPSFDPNIFIAGDNAKISDLLGDPNKPFFDRAISGTYHPGSIFKPFVAIAALAEGVIDKDYHYDDTGQVVVKTDQGDFSYSNWFFTQYGGVEGSINLVRALARSTDTFFYKVGEFLGPDKIAEWAGRFGLSRLTGVDLPGEVPGLVPTIAWKRETKGESWFLGNTYHYAIGQGDLAITPLAINAATAALIRGEYCPPRIVGGQECADLGIKPENLKTVLDGMKAACSSGGTANVFFDWGEQHGSQVACKTGTAQTGVNDKSHAWFSIIAPIDSNGDKPEDQVVITILIEEGGEGSQVAAPIAREILDYWVNR